MPGTRIDLGACAAVLLDMDGTLVDSDAAVERAWTTWADEYGVDAATLLVDAHGSPADHTVRRMRPNLDEVEVAAAARRQLDLQYDDLADVRATEGAVELLARLDRLGLPWAVVTSADVRLAEARLGSAGLTVPVLITVDDISAGKPNPEGFLLAAARLGVDPGRCLVVEDAEPGVAAGRAAGATVAALKGLDADVRIRSLADLLPLLGRSAGWLPERTRTHHLRHRGGRVGIGGSTSRRIREDPCQCAQPQVGSPLPSSPQRPWPGWPRRLSLPDQRRAGPSRT